MKMILHTADSRGKANHGWLTSYHSFSFANYYDPKRMNFGALRVLNDDTVAAGMGFGKHPHQNMEIISIPLEGDLEHEDSLGNTTIIKSGDIQVMSAGTGVTHSEYNKNKDREVKFLQIWVIPNQQNVQPRYDQIILKEDQLYNQLHQILSPNKEDEGVWIHQNAWFHMGVLDPGVNKTYTLKDRDNGIYAFLLEGKIKIGDQKLFRRDGIGIWDTDKIDIVSGTKSILLLMEVPLTIW